MNKKRSIMGKICSDSDEAISVRNVGTKILARFHLLEAREPRLLLYQHVRPHVRALCLYQNPRKLRDAFAKLIFDLCDYFVRGLEGERAREIEHKDEFQILSKANCIVVVRMRVRDAEKMHVAYAAHLRNRGSAFCNFSNHFRIGNFFDLV